ncbi:MAG: hypothetical protein ABL858_02130 [Candidatus Nitrotoga sp.]
MNNHKHLIFEDFNLKLNLVDSPELSDSLRSILCGWDVRENDELADSADMTFTRARRGYDWNIRSDGLTATKLSGIPRTICDAVCDFHYEAYRWYRSTFRDHLCIHAAAVKIGNGIVLFPNTFAAGKSILSVALASQGNRLYADDVVALDMQSHEAVSLGILPRLRLPLPTKAISPLMSQFLQTRRCLESATELYVGLGQEHQANLGERGTITAIVVLERLSRYTPAKLTPVGAAEALRTLIIQNFNTAHDVTKIFSVLKETTLKSKTYKLTYSEVDDAVDSLTGAFA